LWSDSETNRDFLNFRYVAETAAEMIIQAGGKPLSLGVSGGWGVGKSSMVKLIAEALKERGAGKFLFVEFNAWLYQGYDDARAALMDVIAQALVNHGEATKTGIDKAREFLKRVRWLRVAGLTASAAASVAIGLPPPGVIGHLWDAAKRVSAGLNQESADTAKTAAQEAAETGKSLIAPRETESPPEEIHNLREYFEKALQEMDVTLVVFIDDLDRCLPATSIATLEAIRLFLFLDRTAFVIAADNKMIRRAVRAHFGEMELDDDLVTNYFDKLIQVEIRVPPLGTQDVRAYLMLLFIENSELRQATREELRGKICEQLGHSWQGKRVDRAFVASLIKDCPAALAPQLDLADRLAPLMATAEQIAGNPRLIKRFLNTLSIRLGVAALQHVTVDEAALAKMLLFERCGSQEAYTMLVRAINDGAEGRPAFLKAWEELATAGREVALPPQWDTPFTKNWLALQPAFADLDLRAVVYVSREHMPVITAEDQLSSEAAELLSALLEIRQQASTTLASRLQTLSKREITVIMDRLLERARPGSGVGNTSHPSRLFDCNCCRP
jgi:predicted KAP-like P-loop ATPase